jgi:hypothetical protein
MLLLVWGESEQRRGFASSEVIATVAKIRASKTDSKEFEETFSRTSRCNGNAGRYSTPQWQVASARGYGFDAH